MDPGHYAWAEKPDELLSALTITLVQPGDRNAMQVLRPRSEYPQPMTFEQARDAAFDLPDWAYGAVVVQIDELDGWTVLVEPAGWASSDPERLAELGARAMAISVYWNVNAVMQFALARDGSVVRQFDPVLYDDAEDTLPEERDLDWVGRPRASALMLVDRLTGVKLSRDWLLGRRRPTYVVPI